MRITLFFLTIFTFTFNTSSNNNNQLVNKRYKNSVCENPEKCGSNFDVELRAVLINCKHQQPTYAETLTYEQDTEGEMEESDTMRCVKKIQVTLKLLNQGMTKTSNQFIVIDHVTDASTGEKVTLANPYVILLKQKPIYQLYGLKYKFVVNAEAKEEILNKMSSSFTGCDDTSVTPTCGNVKYSGVPLAYSQGFCCSCDEKMNMRRQPRNVPELGNKSNELINIHDLIYNQWMLQRQFSFDFFHESLRRKRSTNKSKQHSSGERKKTSREERNEWKRRNMDERGSEDYGSPHFRQLRGGQDCDDKWTPLRADPKSYHDSAHCLRFSDLWYSVYQLSQPVMEHNLCLKVFQKREKGEGVYCWSDLCRGKTIKMGTFGTKYQEKNPSVIATYNEPKSSGDLSFDLNPNEKDILIPQKSPGEQKKTYPEIEGGPGEFLVVDRNSIRPTGDECDTVGVGYIAFFNQPNRCAKPKNTCLKNQPRHLWQRDKKASETGQPGEYFLKNYARVPDDAVKLTKEGHIKYLALYYENQHESVINLEIKADDNIAYSTTIRAKITEVYVDSTSDVTTILTIKIYNNGLSSAVFRPRITDCPLEIPAEWNNMEGEATMIPPQRQHVFTLKLLGTLPVEEFACTVETLNSKNEVLALRRFRIIKGDRCICAWHCLCACLETTGLGCIPMSIDSYKAAGFIGSMPLTTNMVQKSATERALFGVFYFFIILFMILLMMGITKALIGLCCFTAIGVWGLDLMIGLDKLPHYYEPDLRYRPVVYDNQNWPVHPDTKKRSVRVVEVKIEFCVNVLFFFTFPLCLICYLIRRYCRNCCCIWFFRPFQVEVEDSKENLSCKKCPIQAMVAESEIEDEDCFGFIDESSGARTEFSEKNLYRT